MHVREIVAARQLLGTCFLLRDTPITKGTHLLKSEAGSLLKVAPNKDSKTLVLV